MCENEVSDYSEGKAPEPLVRALQRGLEPQTLADLEGENWADKLLQKVQSRQATMNIGTIGHVAHGKSTVVNAISGVKTTKFHQEAVMNITIHLGYANAKIFHCTSGRCKAPGSYFAFKSSWPDHSDCPGCGSPLTLERHVSFLDCPGHEVLMATMLNGAAIMDAALLLIAANEPFPQPQTREHLHAVEIMHLQSVLVLQNKLDLVNERAALSQHGEIRSYLNRTLLKDTPIVPIAAQLGCQIDLILEHICHFPIPKRELKLPARMVLVRSFDVNKPGESAAEKLVGGVLGGTVQQGVLRVGSTIECRPGVTYSINGKFRCQPVFSSVTQLQAEDNQLHYAVPGGLIAVGTKIDPSLTRQNRMSGQVIGEEGSLPRTYVEVVAQYFLLSHIVGLPKESAESGGGSSSGLGGGANGGTGASTGKRSAFAMSRPTPDERFRLTIGTHTTGATVIMTKGELGKFSLAEPVCCEIGSRFCMSRLISRQWRLVGWGTIRNGVAVEDFGDGDEQY